MSRYRNSRILYKSGLAWGYISRLIDKLSSELLSKKGKGWRIEGPNWACACGLPKRSRTGHHQKLGLAPAKPNLGGRCQKQWPVAFPQRRMENSPLPFRTGRPGRPPASGWPSRWLPFGEIDIAKRCLPPNPQRSRTGGRRPGSNADWEGRSTHPYVFWISRNTFSTISSRSRVRWKSHARIWRRGSSFAFGIDQGKAAEGLLNTPKKGKPTSAKIQRYLSLSDTSISFFNFSGCVYRRIYRRSWIASIFFWKHQLLGKTNFGIVQWGPKK